MNLSLVKKREDLRGEKSQHLDLLKALHGRALQSFTQEAKASFKQFFDEQGFIMHANSNTGHALKTSYGTLTVTLRTPEQIQDKSLFIEYSYGSSNQLGGVKIVIDIVNEPENLRLNEDRYARENSDSIQRDIQNLEKEVASLKRKVDQGDALLFLYQIQKNTEGSAANMQYKTFTEVLNAVFKVE